MRPPFDFFLNNPYLPKRKPMTLTYALIAENAIIMAADSQVTHRHTEGDRVIGAYTGEASKIRHLPTASFTIAGDPALVDALLAQVQAIDNTQSFSLLTRAYAAAFQKYYLDLYDEDKSHVPPPQCAFLFCGFVEVEAGRKVPQIIKLASADRFIYRAAATGKGFAFTGSETHGAVLYLQHRFYSRGLNLEQSKLLAYCILSEVAGMDIAVSGPIEMGVLTEERFEPFCGLSPYEEKRLQMAALVEGVLSSL